MHPIGDIETSQSVNLKRASIVFSGEIPAGIFTKISTFSAVLSSTFFTLILPLSFAFSIEDINEVVVVVNGNSVIFNVVLSF